VKEWQQFIFLKRLYLPVKRRRGFIRESSDLACQSDRIKPDQAGHVMSHINTLDIFSNTI